MSDQSGLLTERRETVNGHTVYRISLASKGTKATGKAAERPRQAARQPRKGQGKGKAAAKA
jgi:hypothetical protein